MVAGISFGGGGGGSPVFNLGKLKKKPTNFFFYKPKK